MKNEILAKELQDWFDNNKNNRSKWNDNPVGLVIKKNLISMEKWKNAPRGNPAKGRVVAKENKEKREADTW